MNNEFEVNKNEQENNNINNSYSLVDNESENLFYKKQRNKVKKI